MDDPPFTETNPAPGGEEPLTSELGAAEVPEGMEDQTAWDEPPDQTGTRRVALTDDPDDPAGAMVGQGLDEADRELRLESETDGADAEEEDDEA